MGINYLNIDLDMDGGDNKAMSEVSKRLQAVPPSAIRKLVPLADEAKKRGVKVIHLNIGDPDVPTPKVMLERLKQWEGGFPYAHSQGDAELIEALVGYYRDLGYDWITKDMIQVTVGGSEALLMAMIASGDPGDEMVVFEPFFTAYSGHAAIANMKLVPVTTKIEDGFHLPDSQTIEQAIGPKTKAMLFTNPNNPTGTVYSQDEVERLVEIARKHNLFLFCDEVYREFLFDGAKVVSLFDYMSDMPEQVVVLDSLSKRYSAPGLRLGVVVSKHTELMAGLLRMGMARLAAPYIAQKVAAQLKAVSKEDLAQVRDEYERRRNVIYEGLKQIEGVTIHKPEGAFYAVVGLPVEDAETFVSWMLTDFNDNGETVMLAPMNGFYATPEMGKNEVRIAYVVGEEKLRRAIELIQKALKKYGK